MGACIVARCERRPALAVRGATRHSVRPLGTYLETRRQAVRTSKVRLCPGFSGFSTVESPRTAGVTDKPRPPPLSREQPIGIGTGGWELGTPRTKK